MPEPSLPDAFVLALSALHEADDEEFQAVLGATEGLLGPSGMSDFAESVALSVGFDQWSAAVLLDVMLTIVRRLIEHRPAEDELLADLVASADLGLDDLSQAQLRDRIKAIARQPQLGVLAKSLDLLRAHERLFLGAKILTDIRPVFGDDAAEGAKAAVLVHALRIDFLHAGEPESIVMALEHRDLLGMEREIDRAMAKSTSLRSVLDTAQIPSPIL